MKYINKHLKIELPNGETVDFGKDKIESVMQENNTLIIKLKATEGKELKN